MCKSNPIFNWAKISELQQKKVLSKDAYVENTLQVINFDDIMQDSLVVGTDTLHASLDVNVGSTSITSVIFPKSASQFT